MLPTLCYMYIFLDPGAGGAVIRMVCVINYLLFVSGFSSTYPLSFDSNNMADHSVFISFGSKQ